LSNKSDLGERSSLSNNTSTDELAKNERTTGGKEGALNEDKSIKRSVSKDYEKKNVGSCTNSNMESPTVETDIEKKTHDRDDQDGDWLSAWGFSPLTQLTAVKNTVIDEFFHRSD